MAQSFKGTISFGLVYIPVRLSAAARSKDIGFHLIDRRTMGRIRYKKTSAEGDREVRPEDIVKGYEYEDDRYVIFEDKDFEKLKTKRDKSIVIDRFVALDEIDPVYYEKSYYVRPAGAERAYSLLLAAMEERNRVGIAKTVLGTRETLIALRAQGGRMLLSTLYFADELQEAPAQERGEELNPRELELARGIIDNMTAPFAPEEYRDEYRARLLEAVESKIAGREPELPRERAAAKVSDLLDALTRSLKDAEGAKRGARAVGTGKKKRAEALG